MKHWKKNHCSSQLRSTQLKIAPTNAHTEISECIALNKFPLQFQFMKTTVTSAVMAENFSCVTREAVPSATTGIASAGLLQPVGSGFVRGTSVMTAVNGPTSCAPNARILTVERMRLVKSQK